MKNAICIVSGNGVSGTVRFSQKSPSAPVLVSIHIKGLKKKKHGIHAIHIHEYGDTTSGCASLGGHWNPTRTSHGCVGVTTTSHAGDLINNINPDEEGEVHVEFMDRRLTLHGDENILGRSVVIHASPDDLGLQGIVSYSQNKNHVVRYRDMSENELRSFIRERELTTDPLIVNGNKAIMVRFLDTNSLSTGNAGKRLACGIIGLSK
jgi:Cu-Zn family superoxide dismutase